LSFGKHRTSPLVGFILIGIIAISSTAFASGIQGLNTAINGGQARQSIGNYTLDTMTFVPASNGDKFDTIAFTLTPAAGTASLAVASGACATANKAGQITVNSVVHCVAIEINVTETGGDGSTGTWRNDICTVDGSDVVTCDFSTDNGSTGFAFSAVTSFDVRIYNDD